MIGTVGDVLNSSPTDLTRKGKCTGCGECCSNILPLSDAEIKRIKEYVKLNNVKEQSHFIIGMATKPKMDLSCPFMKASGDKRCVIYDIRPAICRDYVCNKSSKDMSEELLKEKRKPVFMRETFFGKEKK